MNIGASTRSVGVAFVAAGAALALAACGSGSSGSAGASTGASAGSVAGKTIGFSPYTLQAPALQGLAKGLEGMAGAQGLKVISADPKGDPTTQQQQLQGWVSRGQVQAIWVLPTAGPALKGVLTQAQAKKIPVIAAGSPADFGFSGPQKGITFSQPDNAAYGAMMAELITKCINDRLGGQGTLIYVKDPRESSQNTAINNALTSGVKSASPNVTIVEVNGDDRLKAKQNVSSALQANKGANAVVGTNDEGTLGGLTAFEAAGKKGDAICAAGAGGGDEAVAAVKSGRLFGDVAFDFEKDLAQNLATLTGMLQAPDTVGKELTIPMKTVTADSAS